jgi:hypothetical protein
MTTEIVRTFSLESTGLPDLLFIVSCMGISGLLVSRCELKDRVNLEVVFEKRQKDGNAT